MFGGDNRMFMSPSPVQNGFNLILLPPTLQRRRNALKALSIPPWPPSTVALQLSRNATAGSAHSVWRSSPRPPAIFCMFAAWAVPSAPPRETDACSVIKPLQNSWKSISPAQQSLVRYNGNRRSYLERVCNRTAAISVDRPENLHALLVRDAHIQCLQHPLELAKIDLAIPVVICLRSNQTQQKHQRGRHSGAGDARNPPHLAPKYLEAFSIALPRAP
jgi:hypothetical protein